jgi:hypothetical protein
MYIVSCAVEVIEVISYSHRLLFRGFFFLSLLLQLIVRHSDDGQDQVHEVERAQEDDHNEEKHVPWPR